MEEKELKNALEKAEAAFREMVEPFKSIMYAAAASAIIKHYQVGRKVLRSGELIVPKLIANRLLWGDLQLGIVNSRELGIEFQPPPPINKEAVDSLVKNILDNK